MMWMNFVVLQLVGVVVALWWAPSWRNVLLAAWLAAWVWWLAWVVQSFRFYLWAKEEGASARRFRGLWGELQYFWRKLQRKHQQTQHALFHDLHELRTAVQASPNGVMLLQANWSIAWLNRMSCEHFGLDAKDVGQNLLTLVRDPAFGSYCAVGDFREGLEMDGRGLGGRRRLAIQVFPYGDAGKLLVLSSDITHVQQVDAMRRDFVANVSHEIRTPLTIFSGYVQTLQSVPMDDAQRQECYQSMSLQARRMQLLVEDLLMLSRLEGSPLPDLGDVVQVSALLRRLRDEALALSGALAHKAEQKSAQAAALAAPAQLGEAPEKIAHEPVHVVAVFFVDAQGQRHAVSDDDDVDEDADADAAMGQICGVEKEIHSAFANLVANAVRYTPAGGRIELLWQRRADGSATFAVRDTGPGIAAEHLPRLTERFYRVDLSRSRESGGTGLGLAIVKHVVQRHGGDLHIESTPGQGSCFEISLPAVRLQWEEGG